MAKIYKIKENNENIEYAVRYLTRAKRSLGEISESIDKLSVAEKTDRDDLLENLRDYLNTADKAQNNLKDAFQYIKRVKLGKNRLDLIKEYRNLRRITSMVVDKISAAIGRAHVLGLDSQQVINDLSRIFNPSIERDRQVSQNHAKEAEARAKEAEQKAIEATARQKEAEALKDAKKFEAETVAEQTRKANLELLESIRAKDAQIVAQARETIDIASKAMDKAIKEENIQKVKEQAAIIKQQSAEVTKISGQQSRFTGDKKHKMFDGVFKDIKQNIGLEIKETLNNTAYKVINTKTPLQSTTEY